MFLDKKQVEKKLDNFEKKIDLLLKRGRKSA